MLKRVKKGFKEGIEEAKRVVQATPSCFFSMVDDFIEWVGRKIEEITAFLTFWFLIPFPLLTIFFTILLPKAWVLWVFYFGVLLPFTIKIIPLVIGWFFIPIVKLFKKLK